MKWTVEFTGKAKKQADKLPVRVRQTLFQLVREIELNQPDPFEAIGPTTRNCPAKNTTATSRKVIQPMLQSGENTKEKYD